MRKQRLQGQVLELGLKLPREERQPAAQPEPGQGPGLRLPRGERQPPAQLELGLARGLRLPRGERQPPAQPGLGLAPARWPRAAVRAQGLLRRGWAAAQGRAQAQRLPGRRQLAAPEARARVLLQQELARAWAQVLRTPERQLAVPAEMERGLLPQGWAPPLEPAPALALGAV